MKTKICTDIEQSKKLLELGLSAETADMCYREDLLWCKPYLKEVEFENDWIAHGGFPHTINAPAWSLSALWDIYNCLGCGPFNFGGDDFPAELLMETLYKGICIDLKEYGTKVNDILEEEGYIKTEKKL